ncbi:MAG: glycosyltransferase family 4 protein [Desulfobacteraceae bacterium]|nr:glycosyltransferase family 4 protein [Desulfobacteraceae bacterium]MBC2754843.1 glycosyltransferase family 4 protein [Desulfobacteraceae bacterium]
MAHLTKNIQSKMINVAFILTPIDFGGAERVSLNLLKAYDREKYNIVPVLLIRPWEEKTFFAREVEKLSIEYLSIPVAIRPLEDGKDYFRILNCYRILFSILRKETFSIIHTNGYFADIIGIPLAKFFRIPHMSTCHGYIDNDINLKLYNIIDIFLLKYSNQIISVADNIKNKLIKRGISENKISTITNAVLLPTLTSKEISKKRILIRRELNIKNDETLIGYVGRLSKEKGLKYLLTAGKELLDAGLPVKIILIGDGPLREDLKALMDNLGLQNYVIITGFKEDVTAMLPALDMFILPSLTEGTPMALLEAMSYGIPVVATLVGGIPKVINNRKNGLLVSPSNSSEIVNAVMELINDKNLWEKISQGSKNSIQERFDLKKWVRKIETFYLDLAEKKKYRCYHDTIKDWIGNFWNLLIIIRYL